MSDYFAEFTVPGKAVAKGRPIYSRWNHTQRTPEKTVTYESTVALFASQAMGSKPPTSAPVYLRITVKIEIPASWPAWKRKKAAAGEMAPTVKPDLDNVAKSIKDALNGIVWRDDAQVTSCMLIKSYADIGSVDVFVSELNQMAAQAKRAAA